MVGINSITMLQRAYRSHQLLKASTQGLADECNLMVIPQIRQSGQRLLKPLTGFPSFGNTPRDFSGQPHPKFEEEERQFRDGHDPSRETSSSQRQQEAQSEKSSEQNGFNETGEGSQETSNEKKSTGWSQFASTFKSRLNKPNEGHLKDRMGKLFNRVWDEVKDAVMPQEEVLSATRVRTGGIAMNESTVGADRDMVLVNKPKSAWQNLFSRFTSQAQGSSLFSRVKGWQNQGKEFAEDIKDRIETSDHPMMHKIQDVQDRLFTEPEAAQVMRQIRIREPSFDMVRFLKSIRRDVPVVIKAYLEGKHSVLKEHCTEEMSERLTGMYNHYAEQGNFQDPTLLFVSDVELFDATFVDNQPVLLVTFTCQQINCVRDRFSNVIEGKEDEIQQVYYAWALQQDEQGTMDDNKRLLPPRWQLREMMIRLQHNLL